MDWQNTLYNGLIEDKGKTPKVATGNITKPMVENQLSERMTPTLEVFSDNSRNRGLLTKIINDNLFIDLLVSFLKNKKNNYHIFFTCMIQYELPIAE